MSGYFLKNPGSTLDFSFDWGFQMFEAGEVISTDLGWTVAPDDAAGGGLSVAGSSSTPTTTTADLAGGIPGHAYLVSSRVQTSLGREVQRSMTVRIANN